jgi:hypothetical protein
MSILIQQTQREMHESHALSRRVEIVGIKLSSAAFSAPKALPLEIEETLSVGVRYALQDATVFNECIQATTLFECIINESSESEELDPVAKFECSLIATYKVQEGYSPTKAELGAFHKANVVFNCWPYFREFIQNSAARMNIPPPPVPFIRVHVVPSEPPNRTLPSPPKALKKKSTKSISISKKSGSRK